MLVDDVGREGDHGSAEAVRSERRTPPPCAVGSGTQSDKIADRDRDGVVVYVCEQCENTKLVPRTQMLRVLSDEVVRRRAQHVSSNSDSHPLPPKTLASLVTFPNGAHLHPLSLFSRWVREPSPRHAHGDW